MRIIPPTEKLLTAGGERDSADREATWETAQLGGLPDALAARPLAPLLRYESRPSLETRLGEILGNEPSAAQSNKDN